MLRNQQWLCLAPCGCLVNQNPACMPKTTGKKWSPRQIFVAELWLQTPLDAVFTKLRANCDHYLTMWMCSSYKNPACQHYRQMSSLSIQLQTLATSPLESFLQPCSPIHDCANFHLTSVFLICLVVAGHFLVSSFVGKERLRFQNVCRLSSPAVFYSRLSYSVVLLDILYKLLFTLAACQNLD